MPIQKRTQGLAREGLKALVMVIWASLLVPALCLYGRLCFAVAVWLGCSDKPPPGAPVPALATSEAWLAAIPISLVPPATGIVLVLVYLAFFAKVTENDD